MSIFEHFQTLTPKKRRFALALMERGATILAAGQAAGVSDATAYRWARDADIRAACVELEADALTIARRELAALADAAVGALGEVLDDPDTPPGVRLRAADLILTRHLQIREATTIEERLAALESDE